MVSIYWWIEVIRKRLLIFYVRQQRVGLIEYGIKNY